MVKLIIILFVGLVCEAIGVVLLSQGLKEIGNWLFSPAEITDPSFLAGQLNGHGDPMSRFVWETFSPREQALLRHPDTPAKEKQKTLAQGLNRVVGDPSFYHPQRFGGVALPGEVRKLIHHRPPGRAMAQLNRLLLETLYPAGVLKRSARPWSLQETLQLVGRGATNVPILLGVFFEALFFVSLLILMSKADVSFLWPMTSLSFVVTTVAAKVYLHEEVVALRWAGVCLIMLGAALITWTEKSRESDPGTSALNSSPAQAP
jgi:hypothetical protein